MTEKPLILQDLDFPPSSDDEDDSYDRDFEGIDLENLDEDDLDEEDMDEDLLDDIPSTADHP